MLKKKDVNTQPINVALPNTIESKMEAIINVSEAIKELAYALNSVNVNVTVANNVITTKDATGINIETI
jgi:hypothetical protein